MIINKQKYIPFFLFFLYVKYKCANTCISLRNQASTNKRNGNKQTAADKISRRRYSIPELGGNSKFIFNLQHNNRLITYDTNKMQDVAELEDEFADEPITQNGKK